MGVRENEKAQLEAGGGARAKGVESVDESLVHAYDGVADEVLAEIEDLLDVQAWPSD